MRSVPSGVGPSRIVVMWRIAWTLASLIVVLGTVCAFSAAPVVVIWNWLLRLIAGDPLLRIALISAALAPSYVLFALCLMVVSPIATRLLGWRTPIDVEMRISDMEWQLLRWVRYGASLHLVTFDCWFAVPRHAHVDRAPSAERRSAWEASVRQQPLGERLQPD